MAKLDSEVLKKHHFWLLLIPVAIALLLAWIGLFTEVPDAISGTKEKYEQEKKKFADVKGKARKQANEYKKNVGELDKTKNKMWQQGWLEEKEVFVWPQPRKNDRGETIGYSAVQLRDVENLKFGAPIPEKPNSTLSQFRERKVYGAEYEELVKSVEPIQFRGGWELVLRPARFPLSPTSEDAWLAMEDLWVERALLQAVHGVNVAASRLRAVPPAEGAKDDPRRRTFESRIWRLELAAVDKGNKFVLQGKLTNVSPRLQVMGVDNKMTLKVWLSKQAKEAFVYEVEGDPLAAGEERDIKVLEGHTIPEGQVRPADLSLEKVEQEFDPRTAPVKVIEAVALGRLSDRNHTLTLKMATFSKKEAEKEVEKGTAEGPRGTGSSPLGSPPGISSPGISSPPMTGNTGTSPGETGTGPKPTSQNGLERSRYIDVTEQVRRMPVALTIVTDQSYEKDILEALANMKLRFQTTQFHWNRFHQGVDYRGGSTGAAPMGGEFPTPSGQSRGPSNSRTDQFSANLMQLSVYGLISIYEKFPDEKGKDAGTSKEPAKDGTQPAKDAPPK
jgi:hypothetical protein